VTGNANLDEPEYALIEIEANARRGLSGAELLALVPDDALRMAGNALSGVADAYDMDGRFRQRDLLATVLVVLQAELDGRSD
jgi:hypothetical protein